MKEQMRDLQGIIFDYFRLTATSQDTLEALETTKKTLQQVCRLHDDEFNEAFKPYSKLVSQTKLQEDLDENAYDLIREKLGSKVVRAADRKALYVDEACNIDSWIDNSCELLTLKAAEESTNVDEQITVDDSTSTETELSETESNEEVFIHPVNAIPDTRIPSNQKFEDILRRTSILFSYLLNRLTTQGLIEESIIVRDLETMEGLSADRTIDMLNTLERRGYLCTYEYQGKNIVCFTAQMEACLNKKSLSDLIKRFFGIKRVSTCRLTALQELPLKEFQKEFKQTEIHQKFYERIYKNNSELANNFPGVQWDTNGEIYIEYNNGDGARKWIQLLPKEEYTTAAIHENDGIICLAEKPPELKNTIDNAIYLCLTPDDLFHFADGEWKSLSGKEDKEGNYSSIVTEITPTETESQFVEEDAISIDEDPILENSSSNVTELMDSLIPEVTKIQDSEESQTTFNSHEELYLDDLSDEKAESIETDENLSAAETAQRLLDTSGEVMPNDEEMAGLIMKLLSEGEQSTSIENTHDQVIEAIVLAKLLSGKKEYPVCSALYKQLQAACPLFKEVQGSTGTYLVNTFESETLVSTSAKVCAYINGMLFPPTPHDHVFAAQYKAASDEYEKHFKGFDILKTLYHRAMKCLEQVPTGYSIANLVALADSKSQQEQMSIIANEAKELQQIPSIRTHLNGLKEMIDECFGSHSILFETLDIVAGNRISDRDLVESVLEDFCDQDGNPVDEKLDKFVDDLWKTAQTKQKKHLMSLQYESRKHILKAIVRRLEVIKEWFDETETAIPRDVDKLRALRINILDDINKAIASIDLIKEPYDCHLIEASLNHMSAKLQNQAYASIHFTTLLRSGFFIVENGELILNEDLDSILFAEPWRNMLRHISCTDYDCRTIYKKILDADVHSELYDNYFQLEQLGKLVSASPREYTLTPTIRNSAITSSKLEAKEFREKLEISYAYNRIGENVRERLAALADPEQSEIYGFFLEHNAFGCWRSFLGALSSQIRLESKQHARDVQSLLDRARSTLREDESSELLDAAEQLITQEQNYAVAEDYIHRFDINERKIPYEASDGTKDYYLDFISDSIFNNLYSYCEKRKSSSLGKIGVSFLESYQPEGWTARHIRAAEQFLQKWPAEGKMEDVPSFIADLGLEVECDKKDVKKQNNHFTLLFKKAVNSMADYRHPIAALGTLRPDKIEVVCFFGKRTARQLVDDACQLGFNHLFIVLLDSTLALPDRRKMIEYYITQKNVGQAPFIVIDRLLAIYLALQPDNERLPALLQCTLPYTTYQPFTNGSGQTADEMFFGRVSELASIRDMNGTSIVYGGRQLGKSALLERAQHLDNRPQNHEYAVLTSIRGITGVKAFLQNIVAACNSVFIGFSVKPCSTISAFTEQLRKYIKSNRISKLLLLIDESDSFLKSISDSNYIELQALVDLQRESYRKFKFVFAGLHNVCRAKNATKENGLFGQLGAPLCVRPLNPMDARNLLVRPLRYLGFRITNDAHIDTILTNTNYYPGIIQFFGYTLVQSLASQYGQQYNAAKGNPPYELQGAHLASVINSRDLNVQIRERLVWTLEMDPRYYMLARCIAVLYHLNDNGLSAITSGFETSEIRDIVMEFSIKCLIDLDEKQTTVLLDEMEQMGILSKPTTFENRYLLRRRSFIDVIGPKLDALEREIIENNKAVSDE